MIIEVWAVIWSSVGSDMDWVIVHRQAMNFGPYFFAFRSEMLSTLTEVKWETFVSYNDDTIPREYKAKISSHSTVFQAEVLELAKVGQ